MRPKPRPARPRPGSLERPLSARIYRGAWFVVAIPVLIVAFSVARQQTLAVPSLSSNFDPGTVLQTIKYDFAPYYLDRSPGAAGSGTLRNWIEGQFAVLGLKTKVDQFDSRIPGLGKVSLSNVSATVRGRSATEIVILAHRDNSGPTPGGGANDNASGTAAMLELARAYQNRRDYVSPPEPAHTLVFLSTDGGAFGAVGAARFAQRHSAEHRIAAVIVLDSIAGSGKPRVLFNGDTTSLSPPVLVATANQILGEQPGGVITHTSPFHQLLDLAFPFSLYEQAPFVARGIPAVTLTTAGDRYPNPLTDKYENTSRAHLTQIGQATEQLLAALDQGAPEPRVGSASYIYLGGRFVHGWAIQLLLIIALVPALVTIIDLFARCRRRQIAFRPALRSLARRLGFWFSLLVLFWFFAVVGFLPGGDGRPLSPDSHVATSLPLAALVGFAFLAFGAWLITRDRLLPRRETSPEQELAGYASALLVVAGVALAVAWFNSYALLFLLPPLHAWIWMPQMRSSRPWSSLALLAAGLLGPLLIFWELAVRLHLGLSVFWYVAALAAVGFLKLPFLLAVTVLAAAGAQLAALSVGRYAPYPAPSERPREILPRRVARRAALLSQHWSDVRATHQTHSD